MTQCFSVGLLCDSHGWEMKGNCRSGAKGESRGEEKEKGGRADVEI